MNWAWASSLDQFWRSPTFPMWLTLAAAGFFAIIVLDHAVARREIGRQRRADGHHAAGDRRRGRRHPSRVRSGRPQRIRRNQVPAADRSAAGLVVHRRSGRRNRADGVREGAVRFRRSHRRGAVLCGGPDHAADGVRRCRRRRPEPDARAAGAAPGGRARPLWADGLCAAGARPLHAVGLRGVPVADRSPADRVQHG